MSDTKRWRKMILGPIAVFPSLYGGDPHGVQLLQIRVAWFGGRCGGGKKKWYDFALNSELSFFAGVGKRATI